MEYYVLMLEDGQFVSYEKISDKEVEVVPTIYRYANDFPTLEEACEEAKAIKRGVSNGLKIHSTMEVEVIMKVYSIE